LSDEYHHPLGGFSLGTRREEKLVRTSRMSTDTHPLGAGSSGPGGGKVRTRVKPIPQPAQVGNSRTRAPPQSPEPEVGKGPETTMDNTFLVYLIRVSEGVKIGKTKAFKSRMGNIRQANNKCVLLGTLHSRCYSVLEVSLHKTLREFNITQTVDNVDRRKMGEIFHMTDVAAMGIIDLWATYRSNTLVYRDDYKMDRFIVEVASTFNSVPHRTISKNSYQSLVIPKTAISLTAFIDKVMRKCVVNDESIDYDVCPELKSFYKKMTCFSKFIVDSNANETMYDILYALKVCYDTYPDLRRCIEQFGRDGFLISVPPTSLEPPIGLLTEAGGLPPLPTRSGGTTGGPHRDVIIIDDDTTPPSMDGRGDDEEELVLLSPSPEPKGGRRVSAPLAPIQQLSSAETKEKYNKITIIYYDTKMDVYTDGVFVYDIVSAAYASVYGKLLDLPTRDLVPGVGPLSISDLSALRGIRMWHIYVKTRWIEDFATPAEIEQIGQLNRCYSRSGSI